MFTRLPFVCSLGLFGLYLVGCLLAFGISIALSAFPVTSVSLAGETSDANILSIYTLYVCIL
jgi:hypothetical protein